MRQSLTSLALTALCCGAYAQSTTTESEQRSQAEGVRQQQREQAQRQQLQPHADVRSAQPGVSVRPFPENEAPCFSIERIEITSTGQLPDGWSTWLQAALQWNGPGRCLGAQGVAVLQQRLQDSLIERGFVTSRVLVPPQNLSAGVVQLQVLPGRIQAMRPSSGSVLDAQQLTVASPAKVGDILNLRDLEQALENLQRVPTAQADIRIEPGSEPGSSDWVVQYSQGFPLRGTLSLDDSGSASTGKYQGSATLSWDNPLGLNDLFYFTRNNDLSQQLGGSDPGGRGTQGHTLHYNLPVGYWSLGWTGSSSRYYQSVAGQTQTYVYSGISDTNELVLSRIVYRSAQGKTTANLKAYSRSSRNYVDDTEVQIQRRSVGGWELGLGHKQFVGVSTLDSALRIKRGTKDFDSIDAPEESTGQGTARFTLWQFDAIWTQPLRWGFQALRWNSNLRVQGNETPLTPQDRFAIGGRYTVRGFDGINSLSAERGALWRNDLGWALGSTGQELYLALDQGVVEGPSSETLAGKRLVGTVLGLRGAIKKLQYDFFVGGVVDKPSNFKTAETAAGMNMNLSF